MTLFVVLRVDCDAPLIFLQSTREVAERAPTRIVVIYGKGSGGYSTCKGGILVGLGTVEDVSRIAALPLSVRHPFCTALLKQHILDQIPSPSSTKA